MHPFFSSSQYQVFLWVFTFLYKYTESAKKKGGEETLLQFVLRF
jgi:hypothetical protein